LIVVPFLILGAVLGSESGNAGVPLVFALLLPILYAIGGFIGGLIVAALYNLMPAGQEVSSFTISDTPSAIDRIA
jgi:hypothetical protein